MCYRIISGIIFFFSILSINAQVVYIPQDSILVEDLLNKSSGISGNDKVIFFAESFLDKPYKPSTLETGKEESLVINLREFDCTTFVETVSALYLASESEEKNFQGFKNALRNLRYRNGVIDGYSSRLHYFSEWVSDNYKKGIVANITLNFPFQAKDVHLNYMSVHSDSYVQLRDDLHEQKKIKEVEQYLGETHLYFSPRACLKNWVHDPGELRDGKIIAMTTDIPGLDVTHVGFAIRKKDKIYLLHASSRHKKVVVDPLPLDKYIEAGKQNTGIKVITLLPDYPVNDW